MEIDDFFPGTSFGKIIRAYNEKIDCVCVYIYILAVCKKRGINAVANYKSS